MGKQYRITLGDRESSEVEEMAAYWGREKPDVIVEAFRWGFSAVVKRYLGDRGIERTRAAGLPYDSICQAINRNLDDLKQCRISGSRLIEIRDGSQPTDLEIARLALALGTSEQMLEDLIACGKKECEHVT